MPRLEMVEDRVRILCELLLLPLSIIYILTAFRLQAVHCRKVNKKHFTLVEFLGGFSYI